MASKYPSLFARLVANTTLSVPDDASSCWVWTGKTVGGYGRLNVWRDGRLLGIKAHRAMLEEYHDIWFPFDEAGHLCFNTLCINPNHLEVQTKVHNLSERRGMSPTLCGGSWIPVLFPRAGHDVDAAVEDAWNNAELWTGEGCPF